MKTAGNLKLLNKRRSNFGLRLMRSTILFYLSLLLYYNLKGIDNILSNLAITNSTGLEENYL